MRARAASIFSTMKISVFQKSVSRDPTPLNSPPQKGPPPVWKLTTQFFVNHEGAPETKPESDAFLDMAPDMDEMMSSPQSIGHNSFNHLLDSTETNLDLDLGEPTEDQNVYGDEPGMSNEEGNGQAHDDKKEVRWKPTVAAAKMAHAALKNIICPRRNTGNSYKDPILPVNMLQNFPPPH
jgi:hypothetical protein